MSINGLCCPLHKKTDIDPTIHTKGSSKPSSPLLTLFQLFFPRSPIFCSLPLTSQKVFKKTLRRPQQNTAVDKYLKSRACEHFENNGERRLNAFLVTSSLFSTPERRLFPPHFSHFFSPFYRFYWLGTVEISPPFSLLLGRLDRFSSLNRIIGRPYSSDLSTLPLSPCHPVVNINNAILPSFLACLLSQSAVFLKYSSFTIDRVALLVHFKTILSDE